MTTANYMNGRQQYQRPQGMLWSLTAPNTAIQSSTGFLIPDGIEFGANSLSTPSFMILTDDNRASFDFNVDRIEQRQRMVNGRMRSFHIADKLKLSTSWDMVPSRSFMGQPFFDTANGNSIPAYTGSNGMYTTDGGAGGNEMLQWYENNTGPFYVYLAYDKYPPIAKTETITRVAASAGTITYTTQDSHKLAIGDIVVVNGLVITIDDSPIYTNYINGIFTVTAIDTNKFSVKNTSFTTTVTDRPASTNGTANSRSTLAQYNDVVEMYISDFSYSVQKRGGSNFDFWNVSLSLEEV